MSGLRLLVAVLALTNTISFIAMTQVLPVILVAVSEELQVSRAAVAGASTVATLVGAAAAFPVGRVLDRWGGRAVMTAGSALGAAAVIVWAGADSLLLLYSAFVAIGLAMAMSTYEAAFAVLAVTASPAQRDRAILAVTMIAGLGTYLVFPLLGWMNGTLGWRRTLLVLAVAVAVTAVPGHLMAVPSQRVHRHHLAGRSGMSMSAALRRPRFWFLVTAFVLQAGSISAFLLLAVTYLVDVGHSPAVATAVPVAIGAAQVVSRLMLTAWGPRVPVGLATVAAFAVQGVGLLLLPLVGQSIPLALLCVTAAGLGQGVGVIARPLLVAEHFGVAHFASLLAAVAVPMALAKAVSPLVAAWLGDWRFLVCCGLAALVAAGALAVMPRRATSGH